jgi:hypothetical protein
MRHPVTSLGMSGLCVVATSRACWTHQYAHELPGKRCAVPFVQGAFANVAMLDVEPPPGVLTTHGHRSCHSATGESCSDTSGTLPSAAAGPGQVEAGVDGEDDVLQNR